MRPTDMMIRAAQREVDSTTLQEIQQATALTWAARYVAAAKRRYANAEEYRHEALEHAALAGDLDLIQWLCQ